MNMNEPVIDRLTKKQREALALVLDHHSSKEIAMRLGISPSAVDQRLDSARQILGVATRTEAARAYAVLLKNELACERLPAEPFPVVKEPATSQKSGDDTRKSVFQFEDATTTFGPTHPWSNWIEKVVPEFPPEQLGTGKRLIMILWGAVAIVMMFGLLAALVMGLDALI